MDELSGQTVFAFCFSLLILYALHLYLEFRQAVNAVQNHPGTRTVLSQPSVLGNLLPHIQGVNLSSDTLWQRKHTLFEDAGWDIFSSISAWPKARINLILADAASIKEVTSSRVRFPKALEEYKMLSTFGPNIVATEGDEWKRHRKISAPAFSDRNNKFVWEESCRIVLDMVENVWGNRDQVSVDHFHDLSYEISLLTISVAGFGHRISWNDDTKVPPGHKMSYKDTLHTVATNLYIKVIFPSWAMGLTKKLRTVRLAFDEMKSYMTEMVQARKAIEETEERYDLFSCLLDASENEENVPGGTKLTDSELFGNIFIFLLAGHETTSHALCFALAMLALYPDEQEILYRQTKTICPDNKLPSYEDMPRLTYSMAVLYEALRMFPPLVDIPKVSAEDTSFETVNAAGQKTTVVCPQGSHLTIDTAGLHYNPRYWDDPHSFKPSRFLGDWPRDAFLPFSAGHRGCIGRRFAETESVAALTILVMRYKIEVKEEPQFVGESFEKRKARVLASKVVVTVDPTRVPLTFKRRY